MEDREGCSLRGMPPHQIFDLPTAQDEWRDRPTLGVDASNHRDSFLIALLLCFRSSTPLSACNDHTSGDQAEHEARFVRL